MTRTNEDRQHLKSTFHTHLSEACDEKYFVEFSVKRYKMGLVKFPVVFLREAKRIEQQHTLNNLAGPGSILPQLQISRDQIEIDLVGSSVDIGG